MENKKILKLLDLKGQKILITGGLGFIGSNLAWKCVECGAEVTIFDSLDPNSGGNLYNIHEIRDSVKLIFGDILDFSEVSRAITDKDIIFNCAASTSHPFSMREPLIDLDVNGKGVINLLEAAKRFNREIRFIQVGTSTQLGKLLKTPADENHPEFPTDIYSANKSVSEKYVLIYGQAFNMFTTVVRLSNVVGPRASIHSPEFTFNNYFIGLALQKKNITIYGRGTQLRNIVFVEDVVSALILASNNTKSNGEVFFAVGEKHYSILEISEMIIKVCGYGKVEFIDWPDERKAAEIGDAVLSNRKIEKFLNWSPRYDLKEALTKTIGYYKECLPKYLK